MFYKTLPQEQDPAPLIPELEREVNEWLKGLDPLADVTVQTTITMPDPTPKDGSIIITVTYEKSPGIA